MDADDNVALRDACAGGHDTVVHWLLQQEGVCVSSASYKPLYILAAAGNLPLLRALWAARRVCPVFPDTESCELVEVNQKLLHIALEHHHWDMARFLLSGEPCGVTLPAADSPQWVTALADADARVFWTTFQAKGQRQPGDLYWALRAVSHVSCSSALEVVLAEARRQDAFWIAAGQFDLPVLEFLCGVSGQPMGDAVTRPARTG